MTLSPALVQALAAGRPRFNARVKAAQRTRTGFDTAALADAVATRLDPVVAAVAAAAPDRVAAVADAGFDVSVSLVAHGIAGERRRLLDRVWRELAPACAALVAGQPDATLALLSNAVLSIEATAGARPDEWIDRMTALAPLIDATTLAAAGQVVAWRAGMAHYRGGAIAAADTLPEPLALAAIGATGSWAEARAALSASPWWSPDGDPARGVVVGGFTGFGGPFPEPPTVRAGGQGFFVRSGNRTLLLVADAWGATFHPADAAEFDAAAAAAAAVKIGADGIVAGDRVIAIDLPTDRLSIAATADSIAIASPYSHLIRVQPWRRP